LSQVRQKIEVNNLDVELEWRRVQVFAQAIHGHPTITKFRDGAPSESGCLVPALATLPALESTNLRQPKPEDDSSGSPESLTELLRVPSRSVCFDRFNFTHRSCQATANALMEGTAITEVQPVLTFCGRKCCYDGKWL
jgi:hypothetical protein